ncbi:hypothetical protein BSL82_09155 [Tardibacter chloracetimidivorans]|uniref:Uncharacterized protein n=1 Tax=Tardibacter chloracetimidivorans TaxID=1921510 RepID=A0A1L3ZV20_9SPHN|nr:hypothetical protein [Tardibacter chloracetimidivorans]API59457.1 hypothetical protein BSL82_09155 [Tardibacter chloracetimidivorans]
MRPLAQIAAAIEWINANQGVVSIAIFVITLLLGWVSGIFGALRRKPRFRTRLIEGPTFCCTYLTGAKHGQFDVHRSAFALYLHVSNVGSASSSIDAVQVGYHWGLSPFSFEWLRYRLGWFWLTNQAVVIEDFQVKIGENLKFYPFLFQRSTLSGVSSETFLEVGQSTNGVVYFEQDDSWGGCFPSAEAGMVRVKVRLIDTFGGRHTKTFYIPAVSPEEARKYNPSFGLTLAHLRGDVAKPSIDGAGA